MNRRHVLCSVLLAGLLSGCVVRKAQIVAPYQEALSAYYKALETQTAADLDAAEKAAAAILEKNASDHTARILRANVSLSRLRQMPGATDPDAVKLERRFLADLMTLSAGIGTTSEAVDWVPARALVSMGDFLVLRGNAALKAALAGDSLNEAKAAEAKSLFDAARHYYSGAAALADRKTPTSTPGLAREGANARNGHVATIRAVLNVLDNLDPALAFTGVTTVRKELLQAWEAQSSSGAVTAASTPALSFDAVEQDSMRLLYVTLGNGTQRQLKFWCGAHIGLPAKDPGTVTADEKKALDEGNTILRRVLSESEFEALHASVTMLLRGQGDNTAAVSKTLFWLKRDLKQSCAP